MAMSYYAEPLMLIGLSDEERFFVM